METVLIISSILFLSLSFLFITLFLVDKRNYKLKINKLSSKIELLDNEKIELNKKIKEIKDIFKTNRIGYYNGTINLLSEEDKINGKTGEPYNFVIYVKELDRYTNGTSKIELTNVEVIYGFNSEQYSWVKESQIRRFCSIKTTSDIVWLEVEKDLIELRKEKLNKILSNE